MKIIYGFCQRELTGTLPDGLHASRKGLLALNMVKALHLLPSTAKIRSFSMVSMISAYCY